MRTSATPPIAIDQGLAVIFGSADRVRVLAALANSSGPMTTYRIALISGVDPANAYREVRKLATSGELRNRPGGPAGWELVDPDVRGLLRRRCGTAIPTNLLANQAARAARAERVRKLNAELPLDIGNFTAGRRPSKAEIRRRDEKNATLRRGGGRVSTKGTGATA